MFKKEISIMKIAITPLLFITAIYTVQARLSKLPGGIQLCHKYDPYLDLCLKRLFEILRPKLLEGIPDLGLPPLDPLIFRELDINLGGQGKMLFSYAKITGVSSYIINYIRTDIRRMEVAVGITFPFLKYEGNYEIDGRFMNFNLKGKGPIKGNATEVTSNAELKGRVVRNNFDGERYIEFTSADVDVTLKDYGLQIDELFSDKDLNDRVNALLNDKESRYRKFSLLTAKPIIDRVASKLVLEIINKISLNFSFDQIFA